MSAVTLTEPQTVAAPREGRVLLVAAGAAFLALLDTTVANLAVADVRGDFAGASVGAATWLITIYAVVFAALLAPAGRVADVVGRRGAAARRRGGVHDVLARLRPRSLARGAARLACAPGRRGGRDDPRIARRRARRRAARAAGAGDRALERRGRPRRGRRAGARRRARRHGRLARAVPRQRAGGPRDRRGHAADPALGAAPRAAPRRRRHAAAGRGHRRGRARDLPGPGLGLGRRADRRRADRRRGRRGGRAVALDPAPGAGDRDGAVALAPVRGGQPRLAALRRRAVPVDARRRPVPDRGLGLLAARGRAWR